MVQSIQAEGFMGIAFEATAGTYVAPTKFFPIRSEGLQVVQNTNWRRLIRAIADESLPVKGYSHVEGDISIDAIESVVPYFLYASRQTVVKTGTTNYVYTTTPFHTALPTTARTLSITVVRGSVIHGYVGCVVGQQVYTVDDNGLLVATFSILGRDEASQSLPIPTVDTTIPFGAADYTISIPTGSPVSDSSGFTLTINDNAVGESRLGSQAWRFVRFGERGITLSVTRDFESRTDFDAFKALTSQSITLLCSKGTNNQIQFTLPVSIKDTYEITGLATQGDLIRATINYRMPYDTATSKAYEIIVKTQENIT
jgi:Phage tail tube protein